jgi:predicted kinase
MKACELVIIRGIPGSGKSTYAAECYPRYIKLEADMYFINRNGDYKFDGAKIKDAHDWCFKTACILMNNGYNVVVSNTFTRVSKMQNYLDHAKSVNILVNVIRMNNDFGSIHNVPVEVIQNMKDRFEDYPNEIKVKV